MAAPAPAAAAVVAATAPSRGGRDLRPRAQQVAAQACRASPSGRTHASACCPGRAASSSSARRQAAPLGRRGVAAAAASETATGGNFFSNIARVIKEKGQADFDRVFKGTQKTRENLSVVDELLTYWTLNDSDKVLEELEEALIVADFGPKTAFKIVDAIRERVVAGSLKTPAAIKVALKEAVVGLLTAKGGATASELRLGAAGAAHGLPVGPAGGPAAGTPAVLMIVGVNGGGKTTTIGKLAHRLCGAGVQVMVAAGDTFRAAAGDQLAVWAERTRSTMHSPKDSAQKPAAVLYDATQAAAKAGSGVEVLICDTSGRLHTNSNLMEELAKCRRSIEKALPGAPHEVLLVLDGTTGLNMLAQAREFRTAVAVTGLIVTKLDGTARGGCVVSVVDELGLPVKFVGVGETLEDLQPFDPAEFVESILG